MKYYESINIMHRISLLHSTYEIMINITFSLIKQNSINFELIRKLLLLLYALYYVSLDLFK